MNLIFRVISLGLILKNKHIIVLKKNLSSHQEKTEILNSLIVSDLHQLLGITWEGVKSFNSFSWIHFSFVFSKKTAMSKGTCPFHMKTKFTLEEKKVGIKKGMYLSCSCQDPVQILSFLSRLPFTFPGFGVKGCHHSKHVQFGEKSLVVWLCFNSCLVIFNSLDQRNVNYWKAIREKEAILNHLNYDEIY